MPSLVEYRKITPCFPKDYEDVVGHIVTEADFFTPSEAPRAVMSRIYLSASPRNELWWDWYAVAAQVAQVRIFQRAY